MGQHQFRAMMIAIQVLLLVAPTAFGWQAIGPGVASYASRVVAHPQRPHVLYTAVNCRSSRCPYQGLHESDDGGRSWRANSLGELHDRRVAGIMIVPRQPRSLFAWLEIPFGESPEPNVYRSTDAGISWSASDQGLRGKQVLQLVADPADAAVAYAITDSGFFRSLDGGSVWNRIGTVFPADSAGYYVGDSLVAETTLTGSRLYLAVAVTQGPESGVALLVSTDQGTTWLTQTTLADGVFSPASLSISPEAPNELRLAARSLVSLHRPDAPLLHYVSLDGGSNWQSVSDPPPLDETLVSPGRPGPRYVTNEGGVFVAAKANGQRSNVSRGLKSGHADVLAPAIGPSLFVDSSAGAYRSDDGGRHWRALRGPGGRIFERLWLASEDARKLYAVGARQLYFSNDGGNAWSHRSEHRSADRLFVNRHFPDMLFRAGSSSGTDPGLLERSDDGGLSWTRSSDGFPNQESLESAGFQASVQAMAFDPDNRNRIYAGITATEPLVSGLFISDDGGNSWSPSTDDQRRYVEVLRVDSSSPQVVYAAGQEYTQIGFVSRSTDGGQTWRLCEAPVTGSDWTVSDLALSPGNSDTLYASVQRVDSADIEIELLRSDDGCDSWQTQATLEDLEASRIAIDPVDVDIVYLGTLNGGAWANKSTVLAKARGLMNVSTRGFVAAADNTLRAGFIIDGELPVTVLVKGEGPILRQAGTIDNPKVRVTTLTGDEIVANDDWVDAPDAGLISLVAPPAVAAESALITTLEPGAYVAELLHSDTADADGLIAVSDLRAFDGDDETLPGSAIGIVNVSTRGLAGGTAGDLAAGFIVQGAESVRVLIKAEGPILGRSDALGDPELVVTTLSGIEIARNDSWKEHPTAPEVAILAPPASDSEAALVMELTPGNYVARLRSADGETGLGLIAVTDVRTLGSGD